MDIHRRLHVPQKPEGVSLWVQPARRLQRQALSNNLVILDQLSSLVCKCMNAEAMWMSTMELVEGVQDMDIEHLGVPRLDAMALPPISSPVL